MDIFDSIILGIVEGLTEYLPVSSTGHLIITQYLLGIPESDAVSAFEICIQGGAILAVLGLYFSRVKDMLLGVFGKNPAGLRMLVNVIIGFLPAMVFGLLLSKLIKAYLFSATVVAVSWAVGGLVILLYARQRAKAGKDFSGKSLDELTWKGALTIGFLQCIAMCPGTSRSLMTMLGGLCVGLSVSAAVEFSFLLGLITLSAATVHDAWKFGGVMLEELGWAPMLVGTLVAWLSAVIAVKWMVSYLNRHSLSIFGWYRIAAAVVMAFLIGQGLSVDSEPQPPLPAPAQVERTEH